MAALSTAGRCGRPAPTTISGAPSWESSWQAAQSAETSSGPRSCISSMKTAMPVPTSLATDAASVSSSTRSISMSPESARPAAAGTSMPGCHRSRSFGRAAPGRGAPLGERLEHPEEGVDPVRCPVPGGEFPDGHVQGGGDRPAQRLFRAGFDLAAAPEAVDRLGAQGVEQDRLADPAQPGEHQAALRATPGDPFQHDVEDVQLPPPPGELGWALAGARGVRVADRIHESQSIGPSSRGARHG